ncbi:MAG TPA: sulfatase [Pirellulaceae bacterium]|nr:sulfatase [Pirellulaceae bacterium]
MTLLATLPFALLSARGEEGDTAKGSQRPNFVVVILDDVSPDDLGCYGHPHVKTPNLDAWAKEAMRFDAAFLTCSSCSPSRCSILTGRYPHATGAAELHQPLPRDQATIAGLLKRAGYYTACAGKWHLGEPAKKDFDLVVGGGPSGCEKWTETLAERPKDRPFFLWLAALDAHRPYPSDAIDQPHTAEDVFVPPFLPDVPATRKDLAQYYDEISRADSYFGEVLDELRRQGVYENTFVLFMADNGRPFPRCKTTLYDSGVQTPFVVSFPPLTGDGSVNRQLVSSVDLAPTIAELAGLPAQPTFQGRSLTPTLKDAKTGVRDYVFAEHNWHDYRAFERSVRDDRWLYIADAAPHLTGSPPADAVRSPTFEAMVELEQKGDLPEPQRGCFVAPRPAEGLYDVVADPHQLTNLASDPAHAETLEKLRGVQQAWARETGDTPIDQVSPDELTADKFDRLTGEPLAKGKK